MKYERDLWEEALSLVCCCFFQHHGAVSFQTVFRNPVGGRVSVTGVLGYVKFKMHAGKQDGEAEYI